jgi:ribosome maturation factor RimP
MTGSLHRETQVERVRAVAVPVVREVGLVLEEVTLTPVGRRRLLRVVVDLAADSAGGVGVDAVADASRALSAALDASGVMGEAPYVLEVTSPGADRPLTERRHWARARGRLVRVALADGGTATGRLTEVDDDGVLLGGVRYGWDGLGTARVELEFSAAPAGSDAEVPGDQVRVATPEPADDPEAAADAGAPADRDGAAVRTGGRR